MCRIAGLIHPEFEINRIEAIVDEMCLLLKHGGPDDGGLYISETDKLVLGNRRLALIDLTDAGHQPMAYQNRFHITYNGELYNFSILKEELENLGHQFKTQTDTEVILAAYAQWDVHAFARFNGMFAFALWDDQLKEILLVRDTAGMKPLYFSTASGGLAFASEMRAFKPIPYLQQSNAESSVFLMAYGHIPEPITTLKDVKPLHKGCYFKYNLRSGEQAYHSFAHYCYNNTYLENPQMEKVLYDAVERHLIADASVGVFLSGGLDSAIIATVAAKIQKSNLNSLSLYFKDPRYSEKKFQDILLQQLHCIPKQYLLDETEFHHFFPKIIQDMDMPCCDGINTWFISKYAAEEGLKAVLSGIGADELFGGYPSFKRMSIANKLKGIPDLLLKSGRNSKIKKFNRLSYLQLYGIKGIYLFLRGHFTVTDIAMQLDASENEIWNILEDLPVFSKFNNLHIKNQASWMEFNMYMQNQLLRDADVMGMAHGVEIRVPFLDDQFVRFALAVDPEIKYGGNLPKQWLIDNYKDQLPQKIWDRPKMGFSFPFQDWLTNSPFVKDLMLNSNKGSRHNYERFIDRKLHWSQLMSLILLNSKNEA